MAKIIGTERSEYYNEHIEIYSKNKIGQYSKYLEKNPIFVEYYQVNQVLSRADSGTGSINSYIGVDSPIRYNQIKKFPLYNIPELKPDNIFDEDGGFDIDMELSGIVILPNTIKPIPGDFFYIKVPGMAQGLLFQVNSLEFNSIQSNDFYIIDSHLKYIGELNSFEKYNQILKQTVEKYTCIFDNIGTQDKCIILDDDLDTANKIQNLIEEMQNNYVDIFYHRDVGTFACYGMWTTTPTYLYDLYLIKFLKNTDIFFDKNGERSIVLSYDDIPPINFDYLYRHSLWYAVEKRTKIYLSKYQYYRTCSISKLGSPFKFSLYALETQSIQLSIEKCPLEISLTQKIDGITAEYFPSDLLKAILDSSTIVDDYMDKLIYDWINGIDSAVNISKLLEYDMTMSRHNFWYFPLIIYILENKYKDIFRLNKIY